MSKKEHKYKREKHGIGIEGTLLIGGAVSICVLASCGYEKKEYIDPKPIVVEIPEPCTEGRILVTKNGRCIFEYKGEIEMINDGRNGEEIDVQVHMKEEK